MSANGCGLQQAIQGMSSRKIGALDDFGKHHPQHHQSTIALGGGTVGNIGSERSEGVGDNCKCLAELGYSWFPIGNRVTATEVDVTVEVDVA